MSARHPRLLCSAHSPFSQPRSHHFHPSFLRHASTSTSTSAAPVPSSPQIRREIPPESPYFIHVPQPPQPQAVRLRWMKGTLPVPREIFKPTSTTDKTSPEYLSQVAPEPFPTRKNPAPTKDAQALIDFKAAGSALRRQNLREGLRTLKRRKTITDARIARASQKKQAAYKAATEAPERDDEYLSRATIMAHMTEPALWAARKAADLPARRARYAALVAEKEAEKRNHVHTLYMHAKDFIVTNEQLERRITEAFDEDPFYVNNPGLGIWDKEGFPESVKVLLGIKEQSLGTAVDQKYGYSEMTRERLQKIAEELTGGKM
ncbi:MAG: hypothetical protein LQ340_005528 [Diploschistes diacapsis]|nr:MAG: hypothetical protein LQ340_005528 [Diploschistes diacapsis]